MVVVSEAFADKRLVARHRLINAALLDENGILGFHSLSIGAAKTPAEWGVSADVPASPGESKRSSSVRMKKASLGNKYPR